MEEIAEITDLLVSGRITKKGADDILFRLFTNINSWNTKNCKRCQRQLKIECPRCDKDLD